MKYKKMNIIITDEENFKAVCELLNTLGYQCEFIPTSYVPLCIETYEDGVYCAYSYEVHSPKNIP